MQAFAHIPLGTPIPDSPHAVSCSLPTMASIRGYEEKDPAVMGRLLSGYPRFVVHPFSRRLASGLAARHGLSGRTLWLASSHRMAAGLLEHLQSAGAAGAASALFGKDGVHGVSHPESQETARRAKLHLQHVGGFISSREAEDSLADHTRRDLGALEALRKFALPLVTELAALPALPTRFRAPLDSWALNEPGEFCPRLRCRRWRHRRWDRRTSRRSN